MKVTLNWLKQYVDFDWSPDELAQRLTMLGLEVEGIQKLSGEFEGILVAQILTRDKVPASDKLSVCQVNDGKGERTIICGAQNHQPGDKVALILPNFALPLKPGDPEPFVIKERKVFGIVSQGMMCSPQELGLADDADGLLILRPDAPLGQPFAQYLGRSGGDVVFDLEVTPNRPDLNSVIGIAREIAALTGQPLRMPAVAEPSHHGDAPTIPSTSDRVAVRIEDPDLCPRYVARVVQGVKIAPSPDWLRTTLERVGIRSINNVVDVTNYVMLETGQPLHAFDYHLIAASETNPTGEPNRRPAGTPTIVIRRARPEEKFTTLDGQARTLTHDMLLIADEAKGIALAGVMGGQNSEINERTADVLIESAYFSPTHIRRTSKTLGLRTESSYRFERGADVGITEWASRRCAHLIVETAGGCLAQGAIDEFPQPRPPKEISLRPAQTNALLGVEIPAEQQVEFLRRLDLEIVSTSGNAPEIGDRPALSTTFRVPTFRVDLKREVDLIEEICRLFGVDKIPPTPPRGAIGANEFDAVFDEWADARRILTGLGLHEAQGQTLISDLAADLAAARENLVLLANPLSGDMNVLRPSLLPGLLDSLRHNVSRNQFDVALFEVGRVFIQSGGQLKEETRVALALTGLRHPAFWSGADRQARYDVLDLKGLLGEFLEQFGLRGVASAKRTEPNPLFLESATLSLGGRVHLGEFGQLQPALVKRYDLRDAVFLAELNWQTLLARRNPAKSFKPLPAFPSIRRDVAMLVPESTTHDAVLNVVKQAKPPHLENLELFDVFRGQNVPAGQKSVAYAFTYRHAERTLTDAEVNGAHEKLVEKLKSGLAATIRE